MVSQSVVCDPQGYRDLLSGGGRCRFLKIFFFFLNTFVSTEGFGKLVSKAVRCNTSLDASGNIDASSELFHDIFRDCTGTFYSFL
jgi:hypothetical protein